MFIVNNIVPLIYSDHPVTFLPMDDADVRAMDSQDRESCQGSHQASNDHTPDDVCTVDKTIVDRTVVAVSEPGCRCRRNRCLKMYCECLAAGNQCQATCKCVQCENAEGAHATRLRTRRSLLNLVTDTSCCCKMTKCLKKYCECFKAGTPCGEHCKCKDCENFGQIGMLGLIATTLAS